MRYGCQARSWLIEGIPLEHVLSEIRQAGYQGVEIGYQFLSARSPEQLQNLLNANGLALSAIHWSPLWHEMSDHDARSETQKLLPYVKSGGVAILTSSTNSPDLIDSQGLSAAKRANHQMHIAQEILRDSGVDLLFHNHAWEFSKPYLFDTISDEMDLAVDIAHLERGTQQAERHLVEWGNRVRYLHLRNIADGHWVPALGLGRLPLCEWLKKISADITWAVVEMEPDPLFPDVVKTWQEPLLEYAKESRQYLARC